MHCLGMVLFCALVIALPMTAVAEEPTPLFTPQATPELFQPTEQDDPHWVDETEPMVIRAQSVSAGQLSVSFAELLNSGVGAGNHLVSSLAQGTLPTLRGLTGSKGRLRFDYLYSDDAQRYGGQIVTQTFTGLGIDAEGYQWNPKDPALNNFWTGDVNVIFSTSAIPRMKVRSGAGTAFIDQGHQGDQRFGYNITHGVDVYLLGKGMVTGEIDYGKIDSDNLLHYRIAYGITLLSLEAFVGYESYKLGNLKYDGVVAGVSMWY
ncbi:hypothetical protein [Calycomorphotria hydatis]|uniref:Uncharacterized protein n=1 Tax=Calycomorphotria hydatis TaxID=2528027 RepID=A0A517T3G9_9PLAN|nr:hypothetical protein [Calycomorphotria hydatis]QDT62923.1 hypothetical protein V22_01210 [Calycomorphotria hydatis]